MGGGGGGDERRSKRRSVRRKKRKRRGRRDKRDEPRARACMGGEHGKRWEREVAVRFHTRAEGKN